MKNKGEERMETIRKITTRKSAMAAEDIYDYKKIMYPRNEFLECEIQEEKEEIITIYQIKNLFPMSNVRKERKEVKFAVLLDTLHLYKSRESFDFSLNPKNLYYDMHQRVYVMERDVYARGVVFEPEDFLEQMKALIGYSLQGRFDYEDYLEGGEKLLKKASDLRRFYQIKDLEEIEEILWEGYWNVVEETATKKILVNKSLYQKNSVYFSMMTLAFLVAGSLLLYNYLWVIPFNQAVIQADNAYMEADYVKAIDVLETIDVSRMDIHQKYMLAVSYIKGEDLTESQRNNILPTLALKGTEKQIDYWIYMGRLDVAEAENIALQISDNQLLLYAYLKEKLLIETNTDLNGEEKLSALSAIDAKIQPLAEKYKVEE